MMHFVVRNKKTGLYMPYPDSHTTLVDRRWVSPRKSFRVFPTLRAAKRAASYYPEGTLEIVQVHITIGAAIDTA